MHNSPRNSVPLGNQDVLNTINRALSASGLLANAQGGFVKSVRHSRLDVTKCEPVVTLV